MGLYTAGELQLILDLIQEFPGKIRLVAPNREEAINGRIEILGEDLAGFFEFLMRRMRLARGFLEQTAARSVQDGVSLEHPTVAEDDPAGG